MPVEEMTLSPFFLGRRVKEFAALFSYCLNEVKLSEEVSE